MKKIILINGVGASGKDTFCKLVSEIVCSMNISSVDKIKESAKILGWDGGKTEKDRSFLADMAFLQTKYNDGRYKYISEKIKEFENSNNEILFIHLREPFFIDRIKNDFNAITLLIKNSNVPDIISNEADANVYNYNYDYIINNSGTLLDLAQNAYNFIKELN